MKKVLALLLISILFNCYCDEEASRKFWNSCCSILQQNERIAESSDDIKLLLEHHKKSLKSYRSLRRHHVDPRILSIADRFMEIENEFIAVLTRLSRHAAKYEKDRKALQGTNEKFLFSVLKKQKRCCLDSLVLSGDLNRKYGGGFMTPPRISWSCKEAENGDPVAQFFLGNSYATGEDVTQDWSEAVKWYRKAAEQELPYAQHFLGGCYAYGDGVARDWSEAVKWYRKAAEQGYAEAQYILGLHYAIGAGVIRDQTEAAKWYRKAAEQGNVEAKKALSELAK